MMNCEEKDFIESLKVLVKDRKVRFGSFSHISLYYSVVLKCCPNVLPHMASQR